MKKLTRIGLLSILLSLLFVNSVLANDFNWETAPGHHNQSVLLEPSVTRASDSVYQYGRGEYLAEGSVEIINRGGGIIYISVDTYAYVNVDRILHHVFLEYWDEDENDWTQVGFWEFEKTKEETDDGELYVLNSSLTLTGYETGLYYRVRGLHGVEYHDELEACATETAGILITD